MRFANRIGRRLAPLATLSVLLVGGCDERTGPVLGDWRGVEQTLSDFYYARIEIILDGPPGATAGEYHYSRLVQAGAIGPGDRYTEWTDRWTARTIAVDGRPATVFHLDDLPNAAIPDYLLLSDGRLVPEPNLRHIDLSRNALIFAMTPVPRGTFGYGRP